MTDGGFQIPTEFDTFTLGILRTGDNPPSMSDDEANAIQLQHVKYIFDMKAKGLIHAAGPLRSETDALVRGFGLYPGAIDDVRATAEADPAVVAGVFKIEWLTWTTPAGGLNFRPSQES